MDRTNEFVALVAESRARKKPSSWNFQRKAREKTGKTQFAILAASVGAGIAETSNKLQKLHSLAKRRSLFDDPSAEIQELTAAINEDIRQLKDKLLVLGELRVPVANRDATAHVASVVDALNHNLNRTARSFSEVLELRTESLKVQQRDRELFNGRPSSWSAAQQSALMSAASKPRGVSRNVASAADEVAITMPSDGPSQVQAPPHQLRLLPLRDPYLVSRVEAVTTIERSIAELRTIFSQLASMVAEQGESIDRIDRDVETVEAHFDVAERELLKYSRHLSNNRWLLLKVFAVLLVFSVVFVLFL